MARHVKMMVPDTTGSSRGFLGNQAIYIGDTPGGLLIVVNRFQTGFGWAAAQARPRAGVKSLSLPVLRVGVGVGGEVMS
jgi:hypothetical protein